MSENVGWTPGPWRHAWELDVADMDDWEQDMIWSNNPDIPKEERQVVGGLWYDGPNLACTEANAVMITTAPDLYDACKALCDAIELMGKLACSREREEDVDLQYIEDNWLDYVPQCQADAYRAGRAAVAKAGEPYCGDRNYED